jgi:hypothetical protein
VGRVVRAFVPLSLQARKSCDPADMAPYLAFAVQGEYTHFSL